MSKIKILTLIFSILLFGSANSYAGGFRILETDTDTNSTLTAFFDLRDRESFIQVTNTDSNPARLHIQIFNVGNLCNENNFFDEYTVNDTHVYNMRDIITNDNNPSGVILPGDAYGIVVISTVAPDNLFIEGSIVGNFRILDDLGYEYRTNMAGLLSNTGVSNPDDSYTINFNQENGVSFSDIVGIYLTSTDNMEWDASNVINNFVVLDVDIVNNNEVLLSCRDIIFACVKPDDAIVDELLSNNEIVGINGASVASFEYGINNAIPHSKGGELLCPGNTIGEGFVKTRLQGFVQPNNMIFGSLLTYFVGLNNGNGRGSMDSFWNRNLFSFPDPS